MTNAELLQSGCDVLGLYANDAKDTVRRVLQRRYFSLCERIDWRGLRRSVDLTFDTTETDGLYLPSDLVNILSIVSSDGDTVYYPTEPGYRYRGDGKSRWFYPSVEVTPLAAGTNLLIGQGETTLTGPTIDGTGEFIRLGGEPGYYKIASHADGTTTLASVYNGPSMSNKEYVIRPPETRKLVLIDSAGELLADTVTVWYWEYPVPLYLDSDIPAMNGRLLELAMWMDLVGANQKRQTEARMYRDQFDEALSNAIAANPKYVMPNVPRHRKGQGLFFGRNR